MVQRSSWISLLFLMAAQSQGSNAQDFQDNTTIWVNGSHVVWHFMPTHDWLHRDPATAKQAEFTAFSDTRKVFESVAFHHAWRFLVFSDQGTNTIVIYQHPFAVYGHVGTSPSVSHVAVDWLSNNIYWVDSGFGWIGMQGMKKNINVSSSDMRLKVVVSTSMDRPYGITVLPEIGRLFWTDPGSPPKLESAGLLGEGRRTLVWQGLARPTAVTADHATRLLYWVDEAKGTVESCDADGLGRRIVVFLQDAAIGGLQLFENYIILSDRKRSEIQAYHKDNGKAATDPLGGIVNARDIIVYSSSLQPRENAPCDNLSCSHICVHPGLCQCSSGFQLDADGKTCLETATAIWKSFLFSNRTTVCSVPVNLLFSHQTLPSSILSKKTRCFITNTSADIRHLAVDSRNATLFYVSGKDIHRYNIQAGSDAVIYTSSDIITGLAYDWVQSVLLWCQQGSILALGGGQTSPTMLYRGLVNPEHVASHPKRGVLFWIEQTSSSKIWAGFVNGTQAMVILQTDLSRPQNLVFDDKTDRLYWLDVDHLGSVNRDGTNKNIFRIGSLSQYSGLAIFRGFMVWTLRNVAGANLTFRSVDLTIREDPVTFSLTPNFTEVTDLVFYDAFENTSNPDSSCELENGGCSQLCLVNGTTHQCQCNFGFTMLEDGKTCSATYTSTNFFLLTDSLHSRLYQTSMVSPGSASAAQFQNGAGPALATFNPLTGETIWYDSQAAAIKSSFLNGSSVRVVKSVRESGQAAANIVGAMRVDASTNNLYFTEIRRDYAEGWIRVISLADTKALKTLRVFTTSPAVYLDIHPPDGTLVYGTQAGLVYLTNMALQIGPEHLHNATAGLSGLAFHDNGRSVVWSNSATDLIGKIPLGTRTPQTLLSSTGSHPAALQSLGSTLYYLTSSGRSVRSLQGSLENTVAELAEFGHLSALAVFGEPVPVTNGCSERNGGCSTLCLPTDAKRRLCQCEDHQGLKGDERTCANVEQCPELIPNGKLSTPCYRYPGETCDYTCSPDYAVHPSIPTISCTPSGLWNVAVDRLCLVTCPQRPLDNGRLDSCDRISGQNCTMTCDPGFDLVGSRQVLCGANGKWVVDPTAQCKRQEGFPAYAIGIICAVGVALIALAVGCILFQMWKRHGGRDSSRKNGTLPTIMFVNSPAAHLSDLFAARPPKETPNGARPWNEIPNGAAKKIPDIIYTQEGEYAELEEVEEVRYHDFSKISPSVGRRTQDSARQEASAPLSHVYHITDPVVENDDVEGEYIEPIADYLHPTIEMAAGKPQRHGPATSAASNYLTPSYKSAALSGPPTGTSLPNLPPRDLPASSSLLPPPPNPHRPGPREASSTPRPSTNPADVTPGYSSPYSRDVTAGYSSPYSQAAPSATSWPWGQ